MAVTAAPWDVLAEIVGAEHVVTDAERLEKAAVDGVTPSALVAPGDREAVAATLGAANEAGLMVSPRGAGTTQTLGAPPKRLDVVLDITRLNRVLEYEPADLTVTVEAGITLGELQRVLGERGQWLPLDPAGGAKRTIGGIIATAASGPHRYRFGTPRDVLIGARVVQADGMTYHAGAKVVKSVAGYELPKLITGSLGTLGVVVEATFKLQPLPRTWATVAVTGPNARAMGQLVTRIMTSPLTPTAMALLDASGVNQLLMDAPGAAPADGVAALLLTRFSGIPQAVNRQVTELRRLADTLGLGTHWRHEGDAANEAALWTAVADLPLSFTAKRAVRLKVAVLPTHLAEAFEVSEEAARRSRLAVAQAAHPGAGVVYATLRGYGEEEERTPRLARGVDEVRAGIAALRGTVVVEHAPPAVKAAVSVWGPTRSDFRLMRALKDQFDPKGTLNPGRFVGGL